MSNKIRDSYANYFRILNNEINIDLDKLSKIISIYSSPDRHYHNFEHINFCLSKLKEFFLFNDTPEFLKLTSSEKKTLWKIAYISILYHDIIYNPFDNLNELNSAELFKRENFKWITPAERDAIYQTILLTASHSTQFNPRSLTLYQALVLDLDLSSFADQFRDDTALIRKEYYFVDEKLFNNNRITFLQNLINKDCIFYTQFFNKKYEKTAREYIQKQINLARDSL